MGIEIKVSTPTQMILNLASKKQEDLQNVTVQISSGNKYTDFQGFATDGNVERFISLNSTNTLSASFIQSNNIINSRINTMSKTVEQLQGIASDISQLIAQRRNSASGDSIAVDVIGKSALDNIAGLLNVKFDGRYLFSGTKSDTPPVPDIQTSNVDSTGNPTASYYQGDSERASIQISNYQQLDYGVTGNEDAFQQLIAAVHLAIQGHQDNDDETLGKALDMVTNAISNLASVRATLGSAQTEINQANTTHNDTNILVQQNLVDISQTNIVEATTKMSELQATIQATYLAFQRMNQLRLSNYLN